MMCCFSGSVNSLKKCSQEAWICSAPPLYFTQTLILKSKFNTFIIIMGIAHEGSKGNFLNFSSLQEINLYRKETAQYILMCREKHQITWHEKDQELVQWPAYKPQRSYTELDVSEQKARLDTATGSGSTLLGAASRDSCSSHVVPQQFNSQALS